MYRSIGGCVGQSHFLLGLIASRRFAATTVLGHFAQTGPVLGRLVRAAPVAVHFAPAGSFFGDCAWGGDCARAVSLPAHYGRAGRVGVFAWAAEVLGHLAEPVPGHFAQPSPGRLERVRARPVPAHLSPSPKLGIA